MSTPPGMAPRPLELLDESTFQSVMCVVAHPDDIEYGLSAAVDKWVKAGKTVKYTVCVPHTVKKEVEVKVCHMVQKQIEVPCNNCGGCGNGCGGCNSGCGGGCGCN